MRLIDADAFIQMMEEKCDPESTLDPWVLSVCRGGVKMMPTVDAVPVIRCADCIRFRPDDDVWGRCTVMPYRMRKNDYCSYGVIDDMRKDGEQHV